MKEPDFLPRETPSDGLSSPKGEINTCTCGWQAIAESNAVANTAACEMAHALRKENEELRERVDLMDRANLVMKKHGTDDWVGDLCKGLVGELD